MSIITGRRLNYFFQKISENFVIKKTVTGGNFNDQITPGLYTMHNCTANAPTTAETNFGLIVLSSTEESSEFLEQIAFLEYRREIYIRTRTSGGWSTWEQLITEKNILNKVYPVGSIYISTSSVNPSTLFGGTWVSWGTGRMPVGVDTSQTEFNTVGKTGGSATASYTPSGSVGSHTLTTSEIPSHKHSVSVSGGSHSHEVYVQHTSGSGSKITLGTSANNDGTVYGTPSGGSHTHTVSETSVGGGSGHNHTFTGTAASISTMPPYITCYMWKRTG